MALQIDVEVVSPECLKYGPGGIPEFKEGAWTNHITIKVDVYDIQAVMAARPYGTLIRYQDEWFFSVTSLHDWFQFLLPRWRVPTPTHNAWSANTASNTNP